MQKCRGFPWNNLEPACFRSPSSAIIVNQVYDAFNLILAFGVKVWILYENSGIMERRNIFKSPW